MSPTSQATTAVGDIAKALRRHSHLAALVVANTAWVLCAPVQAAQAVQAATTSANGVACLQAGNEAAQLACFTAWAKAQSQSQEASSATHTTATDTAAETTTTAHSSAVTSAPARTSA
ncbi:MAG: hypothetical protein NWS83_09785, partial [Burkholderiaceae bacterium]|nr:hypothetical protein [Burkholderiaceae bacterium]